MSVTMTWTPVLLIACAAHAQLQLLPDLQPQAVFGGGICALELRWRNVGGETATANISARILQVNSATVAPLEQWRWKQMAVLPGQTVLESARLEFPAVNAQVRFVVQWWADTNRFLGTTEVLVYPTNLLTELKSLAGEKDALGVLDPADQLKPLLKAVEVGVVDLEHSRFEDFHGRLAIIGPFASENEMPGGVAKRVELMARKGTAVLWLLPPRDLQDKLRPSFESIRVGAGTIVVVVHNLVAGLPSEPQSQLNLIHFCRLALNPEPPRLPHLNQ